MIKAPSLAFADALLFKIDLGLEHRGLPVTSATPRFNFAGWFKEEPSFRNMVQRQP